ncbi:MAG: hypothetical protein D6B25_09220 [Desulfobulbaceae bacterium]|nr:MAG: hypothetical protein D6B25_09220 [Desulfobulbaceae bacterium]
METADLAEIKDKLQEGRPFSVGTPDGFFSITLRSCQPVIGTSIHAGHGTLDALISELALSEAERLYEEDPYTDQFIAQLPLSIVAHVSRYQGDLNRSPEKCIYDEAWGKQVWRNGVSAADQAQIKAYHQSYYELLDLVLGVINQQFNKSVLYDLHSYNYSRHQGVPPLFNIGTHHIDLKHYGDFLDSLLTRLADIEIPGMVNRSVFDELFVGKGYQAEFIKKKHPKTLCIPLEVKKVFMDEFSGDCNQEVMAGLKMQLDKIFAAYGELFIKQYVDIDSPGA